MELKHQIRGERHVLQVRVDRGQHVPVAGDLLFRAIAGSVPADDQILDPLVRSVHALDAARRFGARDDRGLAQRFEHLGSPVRVQLLLAPVLADLADRPEERRRDRLRLEEAGPKKELTT